MNTTPDTRHLDNAIAILGGGKKKPSLKASKAAAKASSPAKVLKLDATTGQMKAVPADDTEDLIGTPKKAPKGGPRKAGTTTPDLVATVTGMTDPQKYDTQEAAVAAAVAAGRERTAVFEVKPGLYMLGSRRRGLLKGWRYLGRAGGLASKNTL